MVSAASSPSVVADTVYVNGHVVTLDPDVPTAAAMAIKDGRFAAVGGDPLVRTLAGADTEVVDLGGATVVPGFNDSHCHIEFAGQTGLVVDLAAVRSVAEALEAVRAFAESRQPGEWVIGSGWHPLSQLAESRYLTRAELDRAAPRNPVYLPTVGHVAMINSSGLEQAGIDDGTPDPEGGTINRDDAGRPTGVLYERAIDLVTARMPNWSVEQMEHQFVTGLAHANSLGITTVLQPWLSTTGIRAVQRLMLAGRLTARMGVMWAPDPSVAIEEWGRTIAGSGVSSWFGNEWMKLVGIKLIVDGILGIDNVSMGTDYPTNGLNPFTNLYLAVTRKDARGVTYGAGEAVTREEALRAYTASGAFPTRDETLKGTISPGKLADLAVLSHDYLSVDAEQIKHIEVARTVVGGRVVFER